MTQNHQFRWVLLLSLLLIVGITGTPFTRGKSAATFVITDRPPKPPDNVTAPATSIPAAAPAL